MSIAYIYLGVPNNLRLVGSFAGDHGMAEQPVAKKKWTTSIRRTSWLKRKRKNVVARLRKMLLNVAASARKANCIYP